MEGIEKAKARGVYMGRNAVGPVGPLVSRGWGGSVGGWSSVQC